MIGCGRACASCQDDGRSRRVHFAVVLREGRRRLLVHLQRWWTGCLKIGLRTTFPRQRPELIICGLAEPNVASSIKHTSRMGIASCYDRAAGSILSFLATQHTVAYMCAIRFQNKK